MLKSSGAQRKRAVELFNRTEEEFKDDIETIKKWLKTQPHLPDIQMDDIQIANFLFLNKCSIENAKHKIDMYFTIRRIFPEYFKEFNPKLSHLQESRQNNTFVVLPNLTKELYTVCILKPKKPSFLNPVLLLKQILNFAELRLREDCWIGDVVIFDMENVTFSDATKVTPSFLAKAIAVYQNVFGLRFKAGYVINCNPFYINVLTIAKTIVKAKVLNRLKTDSGVGCLNDILPRDQIPKDYGGEGLSLQELHEIVEIEYAKKEDIFARLDKIEVNESLRPEKLKNDEILGFYGNFKKLDID